MKDTRKPDVYGNGSNTGDCDCMNLITAKKRIVNFRLTEDEYQTLQKACSNTGARSISDYARSVLLGALPDETGAQRPDMSRRIDQLGGRRP